MDNRDIDILVDLRLKEIFKVDTVDEGIMTLIKDKIVQTLKESHISERDLDMFGYLMIGKDTVLASIYCILQDIAKGGKFDET